MASFQLISDIHLEAPRAYDLFDIPAQAPYLALLGDIGNVIDDGFFTFIEAQLQKFQVVFVLLGNHEPYRSDWATARARVRKFSDSIRQKSQQAQTKCPAKLGEFVFLDQTRYDLSSEVTVLGCTLHSKIVETQQERVSWMLNDFYSIKHWTVEDHCAAHEADLTWLNNQVTKIARSDPHRKIVILTHHSPTMDARAADPVHVNSPITSAFATDLRGEPCWEKPQVRLWAFGHTHYNCDFVEDRTGKRIVANQRGYYFAQSKGYDAELVVRI
ncbi:Ser/Thr protein phosphatase superfamily [Aspergillus clavatus NRRL 1]|uniref:Ser/Thr protein phosphatase superfamily n=1 Tax=Aspergillus clavatus (strain ATCC 1007 / CBS 513.65 / DSM 816 / NCTC 3887 / NRRL 1 / QM 1276 / 107) TaxID=344612 RepID=A1CNX4_ASPCL|nr:Ser/Thr protein phosphatase superfamily [Aspergillus clavatus NRRL 1]EAW07345.1 Ser/Thr protein phosphatase superfamily [Aspergillus clavatus NRRL 1]